MKRMTVERILTEREVKSSDDSYSIGEDEVATLLLGGDPPHTVPGVVKFNLHDDVLEVVSRKGACTFLEYDILRALTLEPKELADRRTGF